MRPSETVQKLLLSSPAPFIGEYEDDDFVVTLAWNAERNFITRESSLTRTFFVLSFTTANLDKRPGVAVPNYSPTGDFFCSLLATIFGKRFDHHRAIEMTGSFYVPQLASTTQPCDQNLSFHGSRARADYPLRLDLGEVRRLAPLLDGRVEDTVLSKAFQTAALFYARALRSVAYDAEVAYLQLITACERLAEIFPIEGIDLEAAVKTALHRIESEMDGGDRIANLFRNRMRQLKRRFVATVTAHLDEAFFDRTEALEKSDAFLANSFPRSVGAAYDLRSRYVHTGQPFGQWIKPRFSNAERQFGKPVVESKDFSNILYRAPTFIGLERLTRFLLLKCAERLGAELPPAMGPAPDREG